MSELFTRRSPSSHPVALPAMDSACFDSTQIEWQKCGTDGFLIKPLMEDEQAGLRTWLMKVEAGAFSPLHAHDEIEQIYVLEGTFYDREKTYGAGEYIVRAAGAMHSAGSEYGAVVLLVYSPAIQR